MTAISTAVGLERRSRTSGYKIKKGFFEPNTPNLAQIVAVLGEANTANQANLDTDPFEFTSAQEVGERYGYGSPLHQVARILRPSNSEGIAGIPTVIIPQVSDVAASATSHDWTVTGAATENATHSLVISGRRNVDFQEYSFTVVKGDSAETIAQKMADAVNSVLSSPATATVDPLTPTIVTLTTKWSGATSSELKTRISIGSKPAGITYSQSSITAGAGAVDLAGALGHFNNVWYTSVINPYTAHLDTLEQYNGIPDPENPTGRYEGTTFMPFMAYFGSTLDDKDALAAITDAAARVDQVTNVLCPAPKSEAFPWEAAANAVRVFARIMQDNPHLDINNKSYPDMPVPDNGNIGDMSVYNNRDFLVKKGCSTVILDNGAYKVQDFVTTYHPAGESPLQYAYARNLNLDWNVSFTYRVIENVSVKDHVLVADGQVTGVDKAIKPAEWKAVLSTLFEDLANRALLNDPEFSKTSLQVQRSTANPDRFETSFRYRRTGIARIESTDVEAGF
ncbi:hypothetical protein [Christiangramia sp.]|uniref:hypothetical protein n=1 Tax=Christiangramia sp. TaxID=1931228 RepID=UPI0026165A63|nr:hypothetical protein [Christiangramia sp.]